MAGRGKVYIVGGGSSLQDFDFNRLRDTDTITVNKSIFDVPNPNYFITVDYSFLLKIRRQVRLFRSIRTTKVFVAALHHPHLIEREGRFVDTKNNLIYKLGLFDLIIKSRESELIGYNWNNFRSGENSGYCALQLAILLGYTKIYLLGIDLAVTKSTHYHEGYGPKQAVTFPEKLEQYYLSFKRALKRMQRDNVDIKVFSCSSISRLNEIISYSPLENI